jgi:two-component system, OmpR family, alkaline phosphatase synthesis response regulator PhoP
VTQTRTKQVLIVEDEEKIRNIIKVLVRHDNVEIDEAADGKEALDKVFTKKYDLIILDLMLPEIDGFEVLSQVRRDEETAEIPVIITSALSTDRDILKGFKEGANYYIPKPFEPQELVNSLELILGIKY